jgi:DNA-directed RNA polymerase sigma subunit (sigma70/sigma32)
LPRLHGRCPHGVDDLREWSRDAVNLDTPLGDDGSTSIGDFIADIDVLQAPDVVEFRALSAELRSLVDTLPPREAMIITLRYGLQPSSHWELHHPGKATSCAQ